MRVQFVARAYFQRATVNEWGLEDVPTITTYFHSPSVIVTEGNPVDLQTIVHHFNERVDRFSRNGSGYTLAWIDALSAHFVKY